MGDKTVSDLGVAAGLLLFAIGAIAGLVSLSAVGAGGVALFSIIKLGE